jgi:hypothetical protein
MRTVVVRVDDADLSGKMAAMREWLDRHRCEPARFVYDQMGSALVISVAFPNPEDAEAFATHFEGQEPAQIASPPEETRPAELTLRST